MMVQVHGPLPSMWETRMHIQPPAFTFSYHHCGPLESEPVDWRSSAFASQPVSLPV